MEKLYQKSGLAFALACIGIYCVLQSLANPLNQVIGVPYSASAVLCAVQAVFLLRFIRRNGLSRQYGLCKTAVPARRFLYYLPLAVLMTRNFWNGAAFNATLTETVCYIICMLCVGFVEEVIFRGLLFRAMAEDNRNTAVVISSLTFGLGHLLNLVNGSGAGLAETLLQVAGAVALGFLFVILFDRGGSLLPCILAHAVINITSIFANEMGLTLEKGMAMQLVLIAVAVAYALILTKTLPKNRHAKTHRQE